MISKVFVVLLPLLLSQIISSFYPQTGENEWYANLNKSKYTPDGWVFGLVWTILYLLIGWSIMKYPNDWLTLNLALNFLWLITFNGWQDIGLSLMILVAMIFSLGYYIAQTQNWLLLPYMIWSLIATYLNGYLWKNN